ncbi:TonB-dependent receptor plug domain protein [Leptospira broomii serovar Hurstbridge str. 5399]|uniref:TonB-dependent receptor plug domain protein n=1 Tax=Leptospira broomii serovar Hurstbridge str. 5399 TaxID=1049789 RepID=T0GME7_9LEPT|nr:TonB-dependent receptor [Leptospira broomii]EQA46533.1 TonB-dependent receptor plug domain protein [Leptospira broomii serovar Hurstbridge str. 5399]
MKRIAFKFLILLAFAPIELLAEVTFKARLFSRQKNQGEAKANVLLFETKKFYKTDSEGYFEAIVPTPGAYTFRIIKVDGMQEIKGNVDASGQLVTLFIDAPTSSGGIGIGGSSVSKGSINVTAEREKPILSRTTIKYDEIKRMPGTFGEPLRSLETIPGVVPAAAFGGGANNYVIRGADPNTNLYLVDDLPILYPFHFDGLSAVVNANLIKSIDVYTGVFPANYNNALGGVIHIDTVDKVDTSQRNVIISAWATSVNYMAPTFGGKGYIMAAARVGYLDKTFSEIGSRLGASLPDGLRLPRFVDSQVKFVHNFTNEHQISFHSFTSKDDFALDAPAKSKNDPTKDPFASIAGGSVSAGQGFRTQALRYTWKPTETFSNRLTLISYDPFTDFNVSLGSIKGKNTAIGAYNGMRQDAFWDPNRHVSVEFGSEFRLLNYSSQGSSIVQTDPTNRSPNPYDTQNPAYRTIPTNIRAQGTYYNSYLTTKLRYGGFQFEPGVRYDYIPYVHHTALGPRGQASYKFEKGTTIFAGGGNFYNFPLDTRFNKDSGNPHLDFQKVFKYGGGIDQQLAGDYQIKGEVFKQEFSRLIVADPYITDPIGTNPDPYGKITQPFLVNKNLNYSNSGTGWSHGFELVLRKNSRPGTRNWFGWITYTWSQTFRNNNVFIQNPGDPPLTSDQRYLAQFYHNAKQTLFDYDRTNVINMVFGWRWSQEWQFGARWSYLTNTPYTPIVGDDGGRFSNPANGQTIWTAEYANNPFLAEYINSRRLKPYHRLDLRFDRFFNYEWGFVNTFFEIINVYLRENVNGQNFDNTRPFSGTNPKPSPTFGTITLAGGVVIPFFNIGIEVKF